MYWCHFSNYVFEIKSKKLEHEACANSMKSLLIMYMLFWLFDKVFSSDISKNYIIIFDIGVHTNLREFYLNFYMIRDMRITCPMKCKENYSNV